jgi:hypothetical protein
MYVLEARRRGVCAPDRRRQPTRQGFKSPAQLKISPQSRRGEPDRRSAGADNQGKLERVRQPEFDDLIKEKNVDMAADISRGAIKSAANTPSTTTRRRGRERTKGMGSDAIRGKPRQSMTIF